VTPVLSLAWPVVPLSVLLSVLPQTSVRLTATKTIVVSVPPVVTTAMLSPLHLLTTQATTAATVVTTA
jgi:hypothetical protein